MAAITTQAPDGKIIDLMAAHAKAKTTPWCAFEYFPPRTAAGIENLKKRYLRFHFFAAPHVCAALIVR